jgi:hypothetical protein
VALPDAVPWDLGPDAARPVVAETGPAVPIQVAAALPDAVVPGPLRGACLAVRRALDGSEAVGQGAMAAFDRLVVALPLDAGAKARSQGAAVQWQAAQVGPLVALSRPVPLLPGVVAQELTVAPALAVC